ncbi:GTPase [Blastopirellula marina]|uniref:GTPase n=1 Tax=Blastopirellula marina TaxID=124 RepID=A0A2S8G3I4_9BACT|nr:MULTISPECIES: DUF3302 domain-containing protein [Pirellulaceae]PQO39006.1 GTPase [Blastopirellula marina]RCS55314.1 DUF3302 domain-containing protein [Bremerella cremea]
MDALSWFALGLIFFVILVLSYGIIALHDVPYHIAKARNHPHQDAIHAGGWISLFTLHAIWPLLWVWAYSYDPETGYFGRKIEGEIVSTTQELLEEIDGEKLKALEQRITELEAKLASHETNANTEPPAEEK